MTLIDPDLITHELLPYIFDEDADAVGDWLAEHVTDGQAAAQLFETLPRLTATLVRAHPAAPKLDGDEVWSFVLSGTGNSERTITARMLVAALNDDSAILTDLVNAVMGWPEEAQVRVMAKLTVDLIAAFRTYREAGGSGS